jgi:hypothetical protein
MATLSHGHAKLPCAGRSNTGCACPGPRLEQVDSQSPCIWSEAPHPQTGGRSRTDYWRSSHTCRFCVVGHQHVVQPLGRSVMRAFKIALRVGVLAIKTAISSRTLALQLPPLTEPFSRTSSDFDPMPRLGCERRSSQLRVSRSIVVPVFSEPRRRLKFRYPTSIVAPPFPFNGARVQCRKVIRVLESCAVRT